MPGKFHLKLRNLCIYIRHTSYLYWL